MEKRAKHKVNIQKKADLFMGRAGVFFVVVAVVLLIDLSSAAHFVVGRVNDSLSGVSADGRVVVLWNPVNGILDNVTDVIGAGGNSGSANVYMMDCELLQSPCIVGDNVSIRVVDSGDGYISDTVNVTITGAGFDLAPELRINDFPNVSLESPLPYENISTEVNFSCFAQDLDGNLANVTLYGNWSGGWHANETKAITGSSGWANFSKNLAEGTYLWNCVAQDGLGVMSNNSANRSFSVDKTPPVISSVVSNSSLVCGVPSSVRINCSVTDNFLGVEGVVIRAWSPSGPENHSASLLSGNVYYADIPLNLRGDWTFECIANDSAGNTASLNSSAVSVYSATADLVSYSDQIFFSNEAPIEKENISISAKIFNLGCADSGSFLVGFYEGDPALGGSQIGSNQSLSLLSGENKTVNVSWQALIGPTNIFVLADVAGSISEDNETDNKANRTIEVGGWQEVYGTLNSNKILADSSKLKLDFWINESITTGEIFASDSEASISWDSLKAIGKNGTGFSTGDDFNEIDLILGMSNFNDSVTRIFTTDGNSPRDTDNFTVSGKEIVGVPIVNSTNSSNFVTGILWDSADDSDGEFSSSDNEDLVFVTKISPKSPGKYGTYDYEIRIPARLRAQNQTNTNIVYFYYELN